MSGRSRRNVALRQFIAQGLSNADYEKGGELDVFVAEAPDLPGCMTQGESFEQARENLIDAIEVWIMATLQMGEPIPEVNGCRLAIAATGPRLQDARA